MKLKECSECKQMTYLWRSKPLSLCKNCWLKISSSKQSKSKNDTSVHGLTKSRPYRIKSVSDKKLVELKLYRKIRDEYLKKFPICEHPTCNDHSEDLHHAKGRNGDLLTDVRYFKALCRRCHIWAEENPLEAKNLGLSLDRLTGK